jgi:hypothetical protein
VIRKIFFAVGDLCRWPCAASDCYMKSVKRRPGTKCERWACVPGTPRTKSTTHTSTLPSEPSTTGSTASLASTPVPPITSTGSMCLKPCDSSDGEGSGQDAERGTNMTLAMENGNEGGGSVDVEGKEESLEEDKRDKQTSQSNSTDPQVSYILQLYDV